MALLACNRVDVQLQVSNLNLPVIAYPRDSNASYARFNGFLHSVSYSFSKIIKSASDIFAQKKTFLIPKFVIDTINISNWTSCRTIQGAILHVISNRPRTSRSSDLAQLVLLTITYSYLHYEYVIKSKFISCSNKL